MTQGARLLHWVHKIGDYNTSKTFYENVMGMSEQRHEEFDDGCEAFCNGRYKVSWTKTMIGYGKEDTHFVLELTANTGIRSYQLGNDYRYIALRKSDELVKRAKDWIQADDTIVDPDNYCYKLVDTPDRNDPNVDPVLYVSLSTSNLQRIKQFYVDLLGMKLFREDERSILVGYAENQCKVEFVQLEKDVPLVHGEAFGRLAISTPSVAKIYELAKKHNINIVTGPIVLSTPNKADVEVIIIQDCDGYEICYADEKGFYALALGC
jgi:catechol 2,3-dioxygenase-like lactoylglutathione lyase family enzyme